MITTELSYTNIIIEICLQTLLTHCWNDIVSKQRACYTIYNNTITFYSQLRNYRLVFYFFGRIWTTSILYVHYVHCVKEKCMPVNVIWSVWCMLKLIKAMGTENLFQCQSCSTLLAKLKSGQRSVTTEFHCIFIKITKLISTTPDGDVLTAVNLPSLWATIQQLT